MKLQQVIFKNYRNCSMSELHEKPLCQISVVGYVTALLAFVRGVRPANTVGEQFL